MSHVSACNFSYCLNLDSIPAGCTPHVRQDLCPTAQLFEICRRSGSVYLNFTSQGYLSDMPLIRQPICTTSRFRAQKKTYSAKILVGKIFWSANILVTCPKFGHFLPTKFFSIRYHISPTIFGWSRLYPNFDRNYNVNVLRSSQSICPGTRSSIDGVVWSSIECNTPLDVYLL